jgi:DNA-binding LytR/AlgR family response regulator
MRKAGREIREMPQTTLHASRNARLPKHAIEFAVPIVVAAFLSLIDAFGLDVLPLGTRFLYWLILLAAGQAASLLIRYLLDRLQLSGSKLAVAATLAAMLGALPMAVLVWSVTAFALSKPLDPAQLPFFYLAVMVIAAAMICINVLAQRRPVMTHADQPSTSSVHRPAPILARLPPRLKMAKLYAVEAEDHYIRVHTSAGSDLVLMRFSDALSELTGIEGAQVHRSWWVARDAVKSSSREDGKLVLLLLGGAKAPVSRSFTRALRSDGWI